MAQIFHRNTNIISKISILVGLLVSVLTVWLLPEFNRSPYITQTGIPREQPIPFSHKHHVNELGIETKDDWEKASREGKIPKNLPRQPWEYYSERRQSKRKK